MRNALFAAMAAGALLGSACKRGGIPAARLDAGRPAQSSDFVQHLQQCDLDDFKDCYDAALSLRDGKSFPRNEMLAVQLLTKACTRVAQACNDLGEMYLEGRGVNKSAAQAARNYQLACDGGDAFGCANLAQLLVTGVGVTKDQPRAVQLFQRACDAKDVSSCYNAGTAFDNGIGVLVDRRRAARDYEPACEGGNAMACSNLGLLFAKGDGVKKSESAALDKFEKGCAGSIPESCRNAGVLLKKTRLDRGGRTPNAFFTRACKLGDQPSCDEVNSGSL